MAEQTALERQIAAMRRALIKGRWDFADGRMSAALAKKGVLATYMPWQTIRYKLALVSDGTLIDTAYAWCAANGLQAEADAFNAKRRSDWIAKRRTELQEQRANHERAIAQIDDELAKLEQG